MPWGEPPAGETPVKDRSDAEIKRYIEKNCLVYCFCFYGAIKNLQFFEAYLLLILMEWGYSLFQIGVLQSIMFAFTYVFEVPSGVIADHYGKKNELLLCFVWYMISFAFYAYGELGFGMLVLASAFYGLGEAFRSGTHKAMIMAWLDKHELGGCACLRLRQTKPSPHRHALALALAPWQTRRSSTGGRALSPTWARRSTPCSRSPSSSRSTRTS